ncbi:death-associated protein kinase 3-like isoform X3 [Acropora palmata]|uniref:death-associated protein kinase 3-like isoform X3 n=1 Tax=Acropora palmata TaxID=6131 RepID=UPI003DA0DF69
MELLRENPEKFYLFGEEIGRLENKELLDFLAEKTTASEEDASRVIAQLVETLNYLHTQNVVHLDVRIHDSSGRISREGTRKTRASCVKNSEILLGQLSCPPANILMSKEFKLTLIDYGNARKIMAPNGQMVDAVGVTEFTAPEVLNFEMTHWAADMWSVGVLLYILLSGKLPFTVEDSEPDEDIDEKIAAKVKAANVILKATDFRNATEEAENLIKRLLVRQPERRPTAVSCLDDPWLLPVLLTQKRKSSEIPTAKFKALNERLKQAEEDERVVASCVLRDFNEKAYESPDEEEE